MEAKEFEKFYSLCERTVSRQRLLGAANKDIAFVLTGMMATLPEDILTLPQHKKLIDLAVGKKEACVAKMLLFYSNKEFEERLERIKKNLNEDTKRVIRQDIRTLWDMSQLLRKKLIRQSS